MGLLWEALSNTWRIWHLRRFVEETSPMAFWWFTGPCIKIPSNWIFHEKLSRLDENLRAKSPPQFLADQERVKKAVERVNNIGPKKWYFITVYYWLFKNSKIKSQKSKWWNKHCEVLVSCSDWVLGHFIDAHCIQSHTLKKIALVLNYLSVTFRLGTWLPIANDCW